MIEPQKRPAPFSVRLTPEERSQLEADATGMSLAAYVKWRLFDPTSPPPRQRGKAPVRDHQAIATLLGRLGGSRIANNLNQLVKAVNSGSLALTPDLESELREAGSHIAEMRALLIRALGLEDAS